MRLSTIIIKRKWWWWWWCLTMADHVLAICRSGYFQLRQLRPVARSLTADTAKTIVHAFIACRLDYCNSLLHGITDSLFRRLQSVQNAAARLITGTRRRDHITPVLRDLHWLPVQRRVDYKLALLVYKSLHFTLLATASWLPLTSIDGICVRPTLTHASSRGPAPVLGTGVSPLPAPGSGTACCQNCDGQTLSLANSVDYWRHFCLRTDSRDGRT